MIVRLFEENALRGHLPEFGFVVPKRPAHVTRLLAIVEGNAALPESIRAPLQGMVATLGVLEAEVAKLDKEIAARAKSDADDRRLMTIPGVGPITATALLSIAPPAAAFENARHFAAWLGLAPRQHSSGGKDKLGRITKAGDKTLRRLLIIGASAVHRHAAIKPPPAGSWLARMMAGKPRMLVAVALANKMARIIWALLRNGTSYQASSAATQPTRRKAGNGVGRVFEERYGATVVRRGRKNQVNRPCLRARPGVLDLTFELHTGPPASPAYRGRTHVCTRPTRASLSFKGSTCIRGAVHTGGSVQTNRTTSLLQLLHEQRGSSPPRHKLLAQC
jgi:Transposase IS116/IS110/IS902 family